MADFVKERELTVQNHVDGQFKTRRGMLFDVDLALLGRTIRSTKEYS